MAHELIGDAVTLRPYDRADLPALLRLVNDPAVAAWWGTYDEAALHDELTDDRLTVWTIVVDGSPAGRAGDGGARAGLPAREPTSPVAERTGAARRCAAHRSARSFTDVAPPHDRPGRGERARDRSYARWDPLVTGERATHCAADDCAARCDGATPIRSLAGKCSSARSSMPWGRGDFSSAEWAHPEIEFVIADFGPLVGSTKGLAGMAETWRTFLGAWEEYRTRSGRVSGA